MRIGDSLRRKIDEGLSASRYGIVVLSRSFFVKNWPQRELDGLTTRDLGEQMILPIWHNVSFDEVKKYSPPLADKVAGNTASGIEHLVRQILEVVKPAQPARSTSSPKRDEYLKLANRLEKLIKNAELDWDLAQQDLKAAIQALRGLDTQLVQFVKDAQDMVPIDIMNQITLTLKQLRGLTNAPMTRQAALDLFSRGGLLFMTFREALERIRKMAV